MTRTSADRNDTRARAEEPSEHEVELSIERLLSRYSPSGSDDFKQLGVEDWRTVRDVLDYVLANRRTGALLPARRRLAILEELARYPALQVAFACASFMDGRGIETSKPFRYFMGIVRPGHDGRGGSAAEKYAELKNLRHRDGRFSLRSEP